MICDRCKRDLRPVSIGIYPCDNSPFKKEDARFYCDACEIEYTKYSIITTNAVLWVSNRPDLFEERKNLFLRTLFPWQKEIFDEIMKRKGE